MPRVDPNGAGARAFRFQEASGSGSETLPRARADAAAAMMIATAALSAASRSVEALLAGEGGVPADELRRLKRKLDKARGLAADAEAKEGRDAGARAWLRELRDALYEVGDAVDDFRRAGARRQLEGRRSVRPLLRLPFPWIRWVGDAGKFWKDRSPH